MQPPCPGCNPWVTGGCNRVYKTTEASTLRNPKLQPYVPEAATLRVLCLTNRLSEASTDSMI